MDIYLDSTAAEPLYRQLRLALERRIVAGHFKDRPLPSSRALAAELGISRNTVNAAYQELTAEGLISSNHRSRVRVNTEMQALLAKDDGSKTGSSGRRPDWSRELVPPTPSTLPHIQKPPDWSRYRYPFVSGQVVSEAFPTGAWARCLRDALGPAHILHSLQDSGGEDDALLIETLVNDLLPRRGINAGPDEVIVTLGSQHALYLIAKALVSPHTRVSVENPGYPDTAHIFSRAGAQLVPADVDEAGVVVGPPIFQSRIVTLTPSHQFPTSVTLSAARRRQILDLAAENNLLIVEDDHDSELRYEGRPTPALKALDISDRVIYVGSLSKFLAPGLRLGYVVAPGELIERLRDLRRYMVRHPPGQLQRALALLVASGEYSKALRRMRVIMRRRWLAMRAALDAHLPWPVQVPTGGVSIWVEGPEDLDGRTLAAAAAGRGVLIEPGDTFFVAKPRPTNYFKLGFGAIPETRIDAGIRILAEELPKSQRHPDGGADL